MVITCTVHILSPENDNCHSWISGKKKMIVGNISWSNLYERMLPTRRRSNPQPPDHQSDTHPTEPLRPARHKVQGPRTNHLISLAFLNAVQMLEGWIQLGASVAFCLLSLLNNNINVLSQGRSKSRSTAFPGHQRGERRRVNTNKTQL